MTEYLAGENSWRLSENFEKTCKERRKFDLEDDLSFSMEMQSGEEDCHACNNGLSKICFQSSDDYSSDLNNLNINN